MNSRRNWIAGILLGLLFLYSMWAYSAPGSMFESSIIAFLLWLIVIASWIIWVIVRAIRERGLKVDWTLFAVPVLGAITVGLIYADASLKARFLVSQPSMTNAAEFMVDHPSRAEDRSHIGSYEADMIDVSRSDGTVSFRVPDAGFIDPVGFIYARDGEIPEDFIAKSLTKMNDHWWVWTQDF